MNHVWGGTVNFFYIYHSQSKPAAHRPKFLSSSSPFLQLVSLYQTLKSVCQFPLLIPPQEGLAVSCRGSSFWHKFCNLNNSCTRFRETSGAVSCLLNGTRLGRFLGTKLLTASLLGIVSVEDMGVGADTNFRQGGEVAIDMHPNGPSKCFDDDGRIKRTGNFWTASAHIITAVIGSGVLSLAWAIGQLGWIAGPVAMFLFSFVTYYTSTLLADCYRAGDPVTGKRSYSYMDAVRNNLGGVKVKICGLIQYANLFGVAIGYTIASSISMMAIKRSNCFHASDGKNPCHMSSNIYMIGFGVAEIVLSQIPDFDQLWWLSIVAAVMSFTYSSIGLALGIAKVAENGGFKGSLTGISIGAVSQSEKVWGSFQAFGDIAFAYSFSNILLEIQDTIKSPPSEAKTMKKATLLSVIVTTVFYMLCGCMGYAAFGDDAPGNLLTGFGFYNPYWLLDIANVAIVVHLVGAYQVFVQPLFAFIEKWAVQTWPKSTFITNEFAVPIPCYKPFKLSLFRLVWRSLFVVLTTVISMLLPFFNDIVGILGALGFWPLTVYFPVEMYIAQKRIPKWSSRWVCLQILSVTCLIISICAAAGSVAGVVLDLKKYKPFQSNY